MWLSPPKKLLVLLQTKTEDAQVKPYFAHLAYLQKKIKSIILSPILRKEVFALFGK